MTIGTTIYEIRYTNKDGSFGAYCGTDIKAFMVEIERCNKLGIWYRAIIHNKFDDKI